jgi:glycosyltransferase involved in cell wall biosynthesis
MKVAYLINTYPSTSHSFIRREIHALERLGVEVHRFAIRPSADPLVDPADREEQLRTEYVLRPTGRFVRTVVTWPPRQLGRILSATRVAARTAGTSPRSLAYHGVYLAEATYLAARCRALGIRHVHAHFGTNSATVAMLAHVLSGLSYSFTVHGPEEFDRPQALALGAKISAAAFTVAISSFGRSQLCRWVGYTFWNRLQVVHCGIEPARFPAVEALPDGNTHLVAIGRLVEQKGQLLLIDAMAAAVAEGADLTLALVGDGPMRPEVEALIARRGLGTRVVITGWMGEAGVRAEIARAHALVMPSFAEGLPMVIMEAMATGRAVIATYVAGTPELVRPGESGWLVPAGDVDALADALRTVARTSPEKLASMGSAGRARVLERHDVDRESAKLARLFAQTLDAGGEASAAPGARRRAA